MNKEQSQSFGKLIWQARRKKGWSQRELAAKVGVDYTYLSKLENDHVEPSEEVIRELAHHLELNAEELMYLAGKMTQRDEEALKELVKANYKEMAALFRRVRSSPGIDSLVEGVDEQVARLQKENAELKAKVAKLEKKLNLLKPYRFYSKDEIEGIANEILRRMQALPNYGTKFPIAPTCVANFLNLDILYETILPDERGIVASKILPLERTIIINAALPELLGASAESIIAHEIGHWVLHVNQDEIETLSEQVEINPTAKDTGQALFYRSASEQVDKYSASSHSDHIEWQAQYFASCLLMPRYVLEEMRKGRDLTKWSHLYTIQKDLGVTISNLVNRLQDLGWIYIPKGSKQIYLAKAGAKGQVSLF